MMLDHRDSPYIRAVSAGAWQPGLLRGDRKHGPGSLGGCAGRGGAAVGWRLCCHALARSHAARQAGGPSCAAVGHGGRASRG